MRDRNCKKRFKGFLLLIAYYFIIFGKDPQNKCEVHIENWLMVMNFLILNHLVGSAYSHEDCTLTKYFFGYCGINVITLVWTTKGLIGIEKIRNGSNPKCIKEQTYHSVWIDIVLGYLFSFPFIVFSVILMVLVVCFPLLFILRRVYGPRFYQFLPIVRVIMRVLE